MSYLATYLECPECGSEPETGFEPDPAVSRCPTCGGTEFELVTEFGGPFPEMED